MGAWLGLGRLREAEERVRRAIELDPAGEGPIADAQAERLILLGEIELANMRLTGPARANSNTATASAKVMSR